MAETRGGRTGERRGATELTAMVCLLALFCGACSSSGGHDLVVELQTDFVPGSQFGSVRTQLREAMRFDERQASVTDDFIVGQTIARFEGVPAGATTFDVQLLLPSGARLVERPVHTVIRGDTAVRLVIDQDCLDVVCPAPASAPTETACWDGACVDPACTFETLEACGEPACVVDADCAVSVACAVGHCAGGACLERPMDERCPAGERCEVGAGCVPRDRGRLDAGRDAGQDAGQDAGRDAGRDSGTDTGPVQVIERRVFPIPGNFSFTVPEGVTSLELKAWGAGGGGGGGAGNAGDRGGAAGGGGGFAETTVTVTPGETLDLQVGAGGFPGLVGLGGTDRGGSGGGGGGYSAILRAGEPLVIAGGGGGGGAGSAAGGVPAGPGGGGGGPDGEDGTSAAASNGVGGGGGTQSEGGTGGLATFQDGLAGGALSGGEGGGRGGPLGGFGGPPGGGKGGNGLQDGGSVGGGGGGGGGYFGGGGGGSGNSAGGGGGGSSFASGAMVALVQATGALPARTNDADYADDAGRGGGGGGPITDGQVGNAGRIVLTQVIISP